MPPSLPIARSRSARAPSSRRVARRCRCSLARRTGSLASAGSTRFPGPPARSSVGSAPREMAEDRSAAEVARDLADALEQGGIPYAIGGAIALGFYAAPRATVDVDVNVFVSPERELARALDALRGAGFNPEDDPQALSRQAREEGQFRGSERDARRRLRPRDPLLCRAGRT